MTTDTAPYTSSTEAQLFAAATSANNDVTLHKDRQVIAELQPLSALAVEAFNTVIRRMDSDTSFALQARKHLSPQRNFYQIALDVEPLHEIKGWVAGCSSDQADFLLGLAGDPSHGLRNLHFHIHFHPDTRPLHVRPAVNVELIVAGEHIVTPAMPFALAQERCGIAAGALHYIFRYKPGLAESEQVEWLRQYWDKRGWVEPDIPSALASASAAGYRLVQGYAIGKPLISGTFGTVAFGTRRVGGGHVACKQVRSQSSRVPLIMNEIRCLQTLNHPNIVKLATDFRPPTEDEVRNAISVDLILEPAMVGTLNTLITASLNTSQKARVASDIFSALDYLHSNGFMHLDIKPGNIGVAGNNTRAVLLDLGCCVQQNSSTSHQVGTIAYLAPEILGIKGTLPRTQSTFGPAADVWAAGLSVIECLLVRQPLSKRWSRDGITRELYSPIWEALRVMQSRHQEDDPVLGTLFDIARSVFQWDPATRMSTTAVCSDLEKLVKSLVRPKRSASDPSEALVVFPVKERRRN